jgi:hypothetical protein
VRRHLCGLTALAVLAAAPATALGHAERATHYPDHDKGHVPALRSSGPSLVVCKPDSARLVRQAFKGRGPVRTRQRRTALRVLKRCRYRHLQAAVNAARSNYRILVMPGVYREEPSRKVPVKDARCAGDQYWEPSGDNHQADGRVPTYLHQVDCPNARNLVAIIGDSVNDPDRECDQRCNLQIQGMGRRARDTVLQGDRLKPDVIRADRADGFQLSNMTVEQGAYNDVDVVETNGFRLTKLVTRWASHYGILTFTTDNGLYDNIEAYGSGDSGVYPGSGPELHCRAYGIEIRHVNSYGNTLGSSGTAGNGTWTHDSHLHDNGAGVANDSFAPGHPGMPQDCSKWTGNDIHSNNFNPFHDDNEAYCNSTPFEKRRKEVVCPVFQVVVGVGFMLYGVNDNVFADNHIYDQHRSGVRLFAVPAPARGEYDPAKLYDTSHGNRFVHNWFGVRPDGRRDANTLDVYWDEQGLRNCWEGNITAPGAGVTSDPASLPTCASGGSSNPVGNSAKLAQDLPCITWHPQNNPDPPGCTWFGDPPDPGDDGGGAARSADLTELPTGFGVTPVSAPGESARGPLAWDGTPRLLAPRALPDDRILFGRLRNTGAAPLTLDAGAARLLDDAGAGVRGQVTFARGFTHGLYGPGVSPREPVPEHQARRMGLHATVAPGESVPFTVSWRVAPGGRAPSRAELGIATVALPG